MIIDELREATREVHKKLDNWLLPQFQQIKSAEKYAQILRAFYGFFKPVSDNIDEYVGKDIIADKEERRSAHSILEDLRALGQPTDNIAIASSTPHINDIASALGAYYVLEGSTLGGVYLSKILADNMNIEPDEGLSFFYGYGKQSKDKWMAFIEQLNDFAEKSEKNEQIKTAAIETFAKFKEHLQQTI